MTPSKEQGPKTGGVPRSPAISLPKGGGAIRGIGETFAANPATGTGSMSVPITTSPGRSGFGPDLSLDYDSGAGNGPFGFGWSLSLPAITRKTDKGLPQYRDAEESDVFVLSGAEDLVPGLRRDVAGDPILDARGRPMVEEETRNGFRVRRYLPRTGGSFLRIERWIRVADPNDVHWRVLTGDNVLQIYGRDAASRIADPTKPDHIFSWLLTETRDDKGNAVLYGYKAEDGVGVDLSQAHERGRGDRNDRRRTANRYLERIRYGNRVPLLDAAGRRPQDLAAAQREGAGWMFEVVFDYGEYHPTTPQPGDAGPWDWRTDAFSSYRASFEIRTGRLCRRVLMFHHFPHEDGVGINCLVRSTEFTYSHQQNPSDTRNPIYTFLNAVTHAAHRRRGTGYRRRSLPPVEFEYSRPQVQETVHTVDATSLENLPSGLDGTAYQWVDLHGEGLQGLLTEQAGAWFYKRNLSPISPQPVAFAPLERVETQPNLSLTNGSVQFLDLAGDGRPDVVVLDGPASGFYEHDGDEGWKGWRPFEAQLRRDTADPNLRFVDLTGDGRADVLISEDEVFVWHPSLGEKGFDPAHRVVHPLDEKSSPRPVLADGTESVHLADMSGDGSSDLVRIRNGEICYWPNLGHGRFGAKVTMDGSPRFDHPDQFAPGRLRLVDIDGTGTTDLLYVHRGGVRLYFNQSGNGWGTPHHLPTLPHLDDTVELTTADLLGNGTACLVWSSPAPGDAGRQMRYIDLMGGEKPHLLIGMVNNLGAETRIHYAPSTRFYLADQKRGRPWITKLPFPVHMVERIETNDHVSHNRFVTRYAYHHGYFDGEEREFRGFGMVEQWDTEHFAAIRASGGAPPANIAPTSHVPPTLTKTWFHTGAYLERRHFANPRGEYYREPGLTDTQAQAQLLPDTQLPPGLSPAEEREACRALAGTVLRQEVYALDGTPAERHPYTVNEQNSTVRVVQRRGTQRHGVFLVHPREELLSHYEREPSDPRVQHTFTIEVDAFGNVLREILVGYGRRRPDPALSSDAARTQARPLVLYTEARFTQVISGGTDHRTPLPAETRTYELTGFAPENGALRFRYEDWTRNRFALLRTATEISYEQTADPSAKQRRLVEHLRSLYRKDDLTALLPLGEIEPRALPGEEYELAFTPGLLQRVFQRDGAPLLPNPALVLGSRGADGGGYVNSRDLKAAGRFPATDADDHWWIPSGQSLLSPDPGHDAAHEHAHAARHFFLPHRFRDPFGNESLVRYDPYDLLLLETRDPVGNRLTAGERLPNGDLDPAKPGNDYRVLQPRRLMDPNRNRTEVAFDTLGLVVGTAVMGKPEENRGDSLAGFKSDLEEADALRHLADPLVDPHALLRRASTRLVYDLFAYRRTKDQPSPQPAVVHTLARETHDSDLAAGQNPRIQHSFSYSDGFDREIQRKVQAEPERIDGGPESPRWIGTGWTIFDNKGNPVRQYEPFFSPTHRFEFGVQTGVAPTLFYDPLGRVVATLHPDHTWEKVDFDPWRRTRWDANDTVLGDPRNDPNIGGVTAGYFEDRPSATWRTWFEERRGGALGTEEREAAQRASAHAETPTKLYLDPLGRPFLTVADNGPDPDRPGQKQLFTTRVVLDIEGNQREVLDAKGRVVMRYDHSMAGPDKNEGEEQAAEENGSARHLLHQASMEAGERWHLIDVMGLPVRTWDSRGHTFRHEYDPQRRPLRSFAIGADPDDRRRELLTERLVYGEQHPEAERRNLRGTLYLHLDQAGAATVEERNWKGGASQHTSRRLAREYQRTLNWSRVDAALPSDSTTPLVPSVLEAALAPRLENETFTSRTNYDALERPFQVTTPDHSILRLGYNEANRLQRVDVRLRGAESNGQPVWTPFVTNIDYDAKGQRRRIDHGNGVSTLYDHDPLTWRLKHLLTRRHAAEFPTDCPRPAPIGWPGCQVQNLHYTYDAAGNLTHIRDAAQQAVFFKNKRVEPSQEFTYDPIYRLIRATGRELLRPPGGPAPHTHRDGPRMGVQRPADGNALGTYTERYLYDAVGNILSMQHRGDDPANPGWTRAFTYAEASSLAANETNNRLSHTQAGNGAPEHYLHDPHGNMIRMPHLGGAHPAASMHWDARDQLHRIDLGGGGRVFFTYGADGGRVRKVWEKSPNLVEERIYLGGFEVFRRRRGTERLERETLHIMDDERRIALVETRTVDTAGADPAPAQLVRYQFGNHLGSASLELDDRARVISYEEYTPWGSTSFQTVRSRVELPKRYRFTGRERDEESGLYSHGLRYYAPWLGRWTSSDPIGLGDGVNLYRYAGNSPLMYTDPAGTDSKKEKKLRTSLEKKHKISIQKGNKAWSLADLKHLKWALSKLSRKERGVLEGYRFVRWSNPRDRRLIDTTYDRTGEEEAGLHEPNLASNIFKISLYDQSFNSTSTVQLYIGKKPVGKPQHIGRLTILHEIAHAMAYADYRKAWTRHTQAVARYNQLVRQFNAASGRQQRKLIKKMKAQNQKVERLAARLTAATPKKVGTKTLHRADSEFAALAKGANPVSPYAKTNAAEGFAETFSMYKLNPKGITKRSLAKWFKKQRYLKE